MSDERLALFGGSPTRTSPWSPWPEFGDPERAALERVLASRSWGGFPSPNTEARAFAEELAASLGVAHTALCANGTVAIQLALQAARVEPGSEVIVPAYTFVATAAAPAAVGCRPVGVDVLPESYCIDPDAVESAITDRTSALIVVHLACGMADMDRLTEIAERRGLLLVEDCAHAHGARWRGRAAGSIGHLGTFSMQSTKLLTAGEGGAVSTDDDVLHQRVQSLANCGRKEPGYDGFPEQMLGHNLRITEWQAAVLREQLRRLPEQHERRARRIARFEKLLADVPGVSCLPHDPRVTHRTAYQWIVRLDREGFAGTERDLVVRALHAEGVPCSGQFYLPLSDDPLFAMDPLTNPAARSGRDWRLDRFPVAARAAYEEAIWLPHEIFLGSDADVDDLARAFAKVQAGASQLVEAADMKPLRVGLIGSGWISRTYVAAFASVAEGEVVGVWSRRHEHAERFARQAGIELATDDVDELIDSADVICVNSPNALHAEHAVAAARAGRHVIVEKPLAVSLEQGQAILDATRDAGVGLAYAEELAFVPKFRRARAVLESGEIGAPVYLTQREAHEGPYSPWFFTREEAGGGVLMDMACHGIECVRWVLGKPAALGVTAQLGRTRHRDRGPLEDHAVVHLEFEGGVTATCEASWALLGGMQSSLEIWGSEGTLRADLLHETGLRQFTKAGWQTPLAELAHDNGYPQELRHFLQCFAEGREPEESGEDGMAVLEILYAAYASAAEARRIALPFRPAGVERAVDLWLKRDG